MNDYTAESLKETAERFAEWSRMWKTEYDSLFKNIKIKDPKKCNNCEDSMVFCEYENGKYPVFHYTCTTCNSKWDVLCVLNEKMMQIGNFIMPVEMIVEFKEPTVPKRIKAEWY